MASVYQAGQSALTAVPTAPPRLPRLAQAWHGSLIKLHMKAIAADLENPLDLSSPGTAGSQCIYVFGNLYTPTGSSPTPGCAAACAYSISPVELYIQTLIMSSWKTHRSEQ